MKLSTTGAAVAAGVPDDGSSDAALLLGTEGATSGRQAEVATPPPAAASHPALAVVADALGLPVGEVRAALVDGRTLAQMAGAQGVDPQTVVDALAAALESEPPAPPRPAAGVAGGAGVAGVAAPDELAALVGLTADELHEAEASGRTLAEIAEANGVPTARLIDALVARSAARISRLTADPEA